MICSFNALQHEKERVGKKERNCGDFVEIFGDFWSFHRGSMEAVNPLPFFDSEGGHVHSLSYCSEEILFS